MVFRDPTKFYILVSLAYAFLIPFSLLFLSESISKYFRKKNIFNIQVRLVSLFVLFWMILLIPLFLNRKQPLFLTSIPPSYQLLKKGIVSDNSFYRTLWIPERQKFSYFSPINPAISLRDFNASSHKSIFQMVNDLGDPKSQQKLDDWNIKYVIVVNNFDSSLTKKTYTKIIQDLNKDGFENKQIVGKDMTVYENQNYKRRFWMNNISQESIKIQFEKPVTYLVFLKDVKKGDNLVFSETFDKNWVTKINDQKISSKKFNGVYNSFTLPKSGSYIVRVTYQIQTLVNKLFIVSLVTVVGIIGMLIFRRFRK